MAEDQSNQLLSQLRNTISQHNHDATFACGGRVAIADQTSASKSDLPHTSPPIVIRWDSRTGPGKDEAVSTAHLTGSKVTLSSTPDCKSKAEIDLLVEACQPATFGRNKEDVLDETYRKAGKLDVMQFSTTFCPYELGIVDVVAQMLAPGALRDSSVRAELYKLNVSVFHLLWSI
jgi:hypothetical protein